MARTASGLVALATPLFGGKSAAYDTGIAPDAGQQRVQDKHAARRDPHLGRVRAFGRPVERYILVAAYQRTENARRHKHQPQALVQDRRVHHRQRLAFQDIGTNRDPVTL